MQQWRGLKDLLHDAVDRGTTAVENIHREMARRPFAILERVPLVAPPTRVVHAVHDAVLTSVYASIHLGNRIVSTIADVAIDAVEQKSAEPREPS